MTSSSSSTESPNLVKVCPNPPSLTECHTFVTHPSCGAISSFVGTTRDTFSNKTVLKLSYEGYTSMAEKVLLKMCDEARSRYSVFRIAIVHRLGDCPVMEASVIICVSSVHRRDSLDCVAWLIDELKANVPIWKKEVYEGDEGSVWKENVEWKEGRKERVMVKDENKDGNA